MRAVKLSPPFFKKYNNLSSPSVGLRCFASISTRGLKSDRKQKCNQGVQDMEKVELNSVGRFAFREQVGQADF